MTSVVDVSSDRVPTGIEGLDDILHGGFLKHGLYLVQGYPGAGKTTLALQYLKKCADHGEKVLYLSLTETQDDLICVAESHDWDISNIAICDLSNSGETLQMETQYTVFHPSEVELSETTQTILAEVDRVNPTHVVFDGLSEMRLLARDALRYRRQMLSLKQYFSNKKITVLVLDDRSSTEFDMQPESLLSGNIILEQDTPVYGAMRRRLRITKFRGSNFRSGYHDYEIQAGGIKVYPRLVASDHHSPGETGVLMCSLPELDAMLGGLDYGTTTLITGPAGVGKTTLSINFMMEGIKQGKKASMYIFDETKKTLLDRAEKLCKPSLRSYINEGKAHIQQIDPAEMSPGSFAHEVRRAVEEDGCSLILIDSLNGYINSMIEESFLEIHLHEMFTYLNQKGVITIVMGEQHGLMRVLDTTLNVSYLTDTVILLRYFEAMGTVRTAINIFKKRTGYHERTLREFKITAEEGIKIGEPLHQYRGIFTGIPQEQDVNLI